MPYNDNFYMEFVKKSKIIQINKTNDQTLKEDYIQVTLLPNILTFMKK